LDEDEFGDVREKPTFIAAFRMRTLRRVRFMSSSCLVDVMVLVDLALPWEYAEDVVDHDPRVLDLDRWGSVPSTSILGILGLCSGDTGVSSNSVVGVSGFQVGVIGSYRRVALRFGGGCIGFSGRLPRLLLE